MAVGGEGGGVDGADAWREVLKIGAGAEFPEGGEGGGGVAFLELGEGECGEGGEV